MLKLAFSYIKKMRRNSLICITGIAVSIMMLFSLVQISELILDNYRDMILSISTYDYLIQGLDKGTVDEIHETYVSRYRAAQALFCAQSVDKEAIYHEVVGVKGDWMDIFQVDLLEGAAPTRDGEICLERSWAAEKGLQIGDPITLPLRAYPEETTVDFVVSGILSDTRSYSAGTYMFVSTDTAESILREMEQGQSWEDPVYVEYILMNRNGFPDEEDSLQFNLHIFNTYGPDVFKNVQHNERKAELQSEQGLYYYMTLAIWGIVIFIAIVMTIFIYYVMQLGFQSKIDQYGTMRALGCSNAGIGRMILSELLVYGCGGMVLGCAAGIFFNLIFAQTIIHIFVGDRIDGITTSWQTVFYVMCIVTVSILAVYVRLRLGLRKKRPIELIHNTDHVVKKKFFTCKNQLAEMVVNNSFRNKRSGSALLMTMTLAFLAVILLGNGLGSISFDMQDTMFAFADLEVTVLPGIEAMIGESQIEEEDLESLRQCADEIYRQGWQAEYHAYDENGESLARVWVYSRNLMDKLIRLQHLDSGARVVFVAGETQAIQGRQIYFISTDGDSIPITIDGTVGLGWPNLAGQMAAGGSQLIIVDEEYAQELFGRGPLWMDVYLSGKDLSVDAVRELLPAEKYVVYDFSNIMGEAVTQLQMMLILLAYMMVALMGLVIFMITSIVKQNFEHRRKEIGMMRAMGADRGKMKFIMCGEVFVLVVIACVISSFLAAPVSMYVYNIINEEAGMAVNGYLIGIPVTLLLCGIVIYGNVRRCLKQKTMELLRSEG